jgi:hypothetical protein
MYLVAGHFYFKSYLKNAFWPNLGVGREFSILEILKYSSGSKFTAALPAGRSS